MFLKRSKVFNNRKPNTKADNVSQQTNNSLKGNREGYIGGNDTANASRNDHTSYSSDSSDNNKTSSYKTEKSFRRGIRDGTIKNKFGRENPNVSISHKHAKNLSFTDSIAEDESSTIKIRKSKMSKIMAKRNKKGICMTVDSSKPSTPTVNTSQTRDIPLETDDTHGVSERSYDSDTPVDLHSCGEDNPLETVPDVVRNTYDEDMAEIAIEPEKIDMEAELRNIVVEMREKYKILNDNVEGNKKLIAQNNENLAKIMSDIQAAKSELAVFQNLLDLTRSLAGFIHEKEAHLEKLTKDVLAYRNEHMEEAYRLRRWLYCDFLRNAGYANVDYKCGDLEDVDDYGHDRSKGVKNSFNERTSMLGLTDKLYRLCVKRAKNLVPALRSKNLRDYLSIDVIDCFIPDFGVDYTLDSLVEIYDSSLGNKDYTDDVLDDVEERYHFIESAMEPFLKFKKDNPDAFEEFDMGNNLNRVVRFYARYSLAKWSPLGEDPDDVELQELDWFKIGSSYNPESIPELLYEVVFPVTIAAFDYWDIESRGQSSRLSNLLSFILQNTHSQHRSSIAEKATNTLIKVIESRLSVSCIKLRAENITDQRMPNFIKYQLINISSNLVLFSSFLSPVTLAKFVLDNIFISKLMPLLRFDSPFDAFVVLQFKASISPGLGKHLEVNTKTNSIVKSTLNRFKEHAWNYKTSCKIFKTLEVPINVAAYIEALNS